MTTPKRRPYDQPGESYVPLRELYHFARTGDASGIDLTMMIEYAPDGDVPAAICRIWPRSRDVATMIRIYCDAGIYDRPLFAATLLVKTTLRYLVPELRPAATAVIEEVDRFCRGGRRAAEEARFAELELRRAYGTYERDYKNRSPEDSKRWGRSADDVYRALRALAEACAKIEERNAELSRALITTAALTSYTAHHAYSWPVTVEQLARIARKAMPCPRWRAVRANPSRRKSRR